MTTQNLGGPPVEEIEYDDLETPEALAAQALQPDTDQSGSEDDTFDPFNGVTEYGDEGDEGEEEPPAVPESEGDVSIDDEEASPNYAYYQQHPPQPQPEVDPRVAQELQAQNQRLRQQQAYYTINAQASQYRDQVARHLMDNEGWTQEQAVQYANSQATQLAQQVAQQYTQYEQYKVYEHQAKEFMAGRIGQAFGIEPTRLMEYANPQSMYNAARQIGEAKREANHWRQQAQAAQRSRVPAQRYDQPARRGGGTNDAREIDRYINTGQLDDRNRPALKRAGIL